MLSYLTAAIWCAKVASPSVGLDNVRVAIVVYTAVALVGIGITGWIGWRRQADLSLDTGPGDTAEDRHQFLAFATLILSGLSAVATIYVAIAPVFIGNCR